jgi:hypothetical protein
MELRMLAVSLLALDLDDASDDLGFLVTVLRPPHHVDSTTVSSGFSQISSSKESAALLRRIAAGVNSRDGIAVKLWPGEWCGVEGSMLGAERAELDRSELALDVVWLSSGRLPDQCEVLTAVIQCSCMSKTMLERLAGMSKTISERLLDGVVGP